MTPKSQRIGIAIIAVVMLVGTMGSFAMFILANDNNMNEIERQQAESLAELERQEREVEELSEKYIEDFKEYSKRAKAFDPKSVGDEVKYTDLKKGEGEAISEGSFYRAYYLGWNPKGKVFDSSFTDDEESLGSPLVHLGGGVWEFPGGMTGGVIEGWGEGMAGMKVGGVRELTIPSDMAYGEVGSGADIPADTPIKFVIMVIEG